MANAAVTSTECNILTAQGSIISIILSILSNIHCVNKNGKGTVLFFYEFHITA